MIFLYGTLRHLPLLAAVLGREPVVKPAHIDGWAAFAVPDEVFPILQPQAGARAEGLLLLDQGDDRARLDYYELGFGYDLAPLQVEGPDGPVTAQVYLPRPGQWVGSGPWSLERFAAKRGALNTEAAQEYMRYWPALPADQAARRYPQVLQRAASRLRAAAGSEVGIRAGGGEVQRVAERMSYRGFFEVAEVDLRFPRFDGGYSQLTTRAAFIMADAVTVLPYDPRRDRVLFVEQFRAGPFLRGDPLPWTLEPIAGRIDADEPPEACARREALEEAGLELDRMIPVGGYYPSPGAVTEYIQSFIGLADLPDTAAVTGGLETEQEDILVHLVDFEEAMAMLDRGGIQTGPLALTLLHLARMRGRLQAEAG